MTNPNESAHDADTGAPAEGVSLAENADDQLGDVSTPPAVVGVEDTKATHGYHAETDALVEPYMGEFWDGHDGWVPAKVKTVTEKASGYSVSHKVGIYDLHNKGIAVNPEPESE